MPPPPHHGILPDYRNVRWNIAGQRDERVMGVVKSMLAAGMRRWDNDRGFFVYDADDRYGGGNWYYVDRRNRYAWKAGELVRGVKEWEAWFAKKVARMDAGQENMGGC